MIQTAVPVLKETIPKGITPKEIIHRGMIITMAMDIITKVIHKYIHGAAPIDKIVNAYKDGQITEWEIPARLFPILKRHLQSLQKWKERGYE
jgi:hypothetical protein